MAQNKREEKRGGRPPTGTLASHRLGPRQVEERSTSFFLFLFLYLFFILFLYSFLPLLLSLRGPRLTFLLMLSLAHLGVTCL